MLYGKEIEVEQKINKMEQIKEVKNKRRKKSTQIKSFRSKK